MRREEILAIAKQNLCKIHVGDRFSTQTKLYNALGIPLEKKDGNKQARDAVSLLIKWELANPGTNSREIIVTQINENAEVVDRRAGNGGAHNTKYAAIVKPALLNFQTALLGKCDFLTHQQIDTNIYGFDRWDITARSNDAKHVRYYKNVLYAKLKSITLAALDSLQNEGLLKYEDIYVVDHGDTFQAALDIEDDETLLGLCAKCWGGEYSAGLLLQGAEQRLNQIVDNVNREGKEKDGAEYIPLEYFQLTTISLMEFLDRVCRKKDFMEACFENKPAKSAAQLEIASEEQVHTIKSIEGAVCRHLNFTPQEMGFDWHKRMRTYRRAAIMHRILGWKKVFKALRISVLPNGTKCKSYPLEDFSHEKLLAALEPYMIHIVVDKGVFNPYQAEVKKRERHKPKVGRWGELIVAPNEENYYLMRDKQVNRLHCKIFQHERDDRFFEAYKTET